MAPTAVPISERRAQTRARLLEAATKVFAERGFHGASVDEIAREAGFSIGALYSNFASKDDLFLALFDEHLAWMQTALTQGESVEERRRRASEEWTAYLEQNREQFLLFVEFWAYAARNPAVQAKFAARMAEVRSAISAMLRSQAETTGREPPMPPDRLALAAVVLARGIAFEKLADPQAVPDDFFATLIARLL